MLEDPPKPGDPVCSNCGYLLRDLTDTTVCPGCGLPLVDVLVRVPLGQRRGVRRRSATTLFGLPLVDIAIGPRPEAGESRGNARGIIAIGDKATGAIAIGGFARGIVAIGGGAIGVCSIGGGSIGLITAVGGGAIGGVALGGGALGLFATGGGAVGVVAQGGSALGVVAQGAMAIGVYARGVTAFGLHVIQRGTMDPEAARVFQSLAPLLGHNPLSGPSLAPNTDVFMVPPTVALGVPLLLSILIGCAVLFAARRSSDRDRQPPYSPRA